MKRWMIQMTGMLAAGLMTAAAFAQTPPTGSAPPTVPVDAPLPSVSSPPLSPDAILLDQIQRQLALKRGEVSSLELEVKRKSLQEQLGASSGLDIPELIGLYGSVGAMRAEFRVGTSVLTAEPGDWVTSRWRLKQILANGVELSGQTGTRTVLFGRVAVSDGTGVGRPLITRTGS